MALNGNKNWDGLCVCDMWFQKLVHSDGEGCDSHDTPAAFPPASVCQCLCDVCNCVCFSLLILHHSLLVVAEVKDRMLAILLLT